MREHIFVLSPEFIDNYPDHDGFRDAEQVPEAIRRLNEVAGRGISTIAEPMVVGLRRYIPGSRR